MVQSNEDWLEYRDEKKSRYSKLGGKEKKTPTVDKPRLLFLLKMVQYYHFHINIQEYYARGKDNLFPDLYGCPNPSCPNEGRLRHHGFYERHLLSLLATNIIVIQRYYCPRCKFTVSLMPSFMVERFQYSLSFIFFVIYLRLIRCWTLGRISAFLIANGRPEFSMQHVIFYLRRLNENFTLVRGLLGSWEMVAGPRPDKAFVYLVLRPSIHRRLNVDFFALNAMSFMAKKKSKGAQRRGTPKHSKREVIP